MTAVDGNGWFEPLREAALLARADLGISTGKGPDGRPSFDRHTTVHCGRPLVYPVPADDLPPFLRSRGRAMGRRYHGVLFAFDLDPPPAGVRYTWARFEVTFADRRAIAVQVHADGDALGLLYGAGGAEPS